MIYDYFILYDCFKAIILLYMILKIPFVMSGGNENGKFDDFRNSRKKFLEEVGDDVSKICRSVKGFHVFLHSVPLFPGGQ